MTSDRLHPLLTAYFARHGGEYSGLRPGPLVALKGGRASSLYEFTLQRAESGDGPASRSVLKLYAPNARGREHATREWRALAHLRAVDYSVPRVILFEPDAGHLGYPFIVMDHIAGTAFWQVFETADSATQTRLTESFVAQLVALHDLDPRVLEPVAVGTDPFEQIQHELEHLRRDSARSRQVMVTEIVSWLERRTLAVPCERPAILHRDYHPWNVLLDASECLWIIDWDWQIGDARFDLAWTCMLMQRSGFHAFSTAVRDEYEHQSDRSLESLAYFEVLTTVRWLLNVLPSEESGAVLDDAARADFQAFLIEPVRQAQRFLQQQTGIEVAISWL